jgi:hypothetical protein
MKPVTELPALVARTVCANRQVRRSQSVWMLGLLERFDHHPQPIRRL